MKEFSFKVLNPGGNKTALIFGNDYNEKEKKEINDYILRENTEVEQVGFLSLKEKKLEMAGGEFCVNASRCAIWEYLNGKEGTINLKVSGQKNILLGGIDKKGEVFVELKIEKNISDFLKKIKEYYLVNLDGIDFIVLDEIISKKYIKQLHEDENKAKQEIKEIMEKVKTNSLAIGVILLEKFNKKIKINPIVWVKKINTLYYETACGSGSIATAIYKNIFNNQKEFKIIQPSGYYINIELDFINNYMKKIIVSGKVIEDDESGRNIKKISIF